MPLSRFETLDSAQKARLLAAAQAEFSEHGYEDASLARIAAAAGISKGTIYYYFADRDDLYATIVLQLVEAVATSGITRGFAPRREVDFWPALEALVHAGFELAKAHPEQMRALRSFHISLRRNPSPRFEPILKLMSAQFRRIVETGRRLGCVRTDVSVDMLIEFLQAADEVLDRSLHDAMQDDRALGQHARLVFDTFQRLLEPRGRANARTTRGRK